MKNKKSGFTLIELMVTIVIGLIVLTIGGCAVGVCVVGCVAGSNVKEKGIKNVGKELWNGNTNKTEITLD
jgi:prepilin-type N-terminal cleavage/methylation domain-containing protein